MEKSLFMFIYWLNKSRFKLNTLSLSLSLYIYIYKFEIELCKFVNKFIRYQIIIINY